MRIPNNKIYSNEHNPHPNTFKIMDKKELLKPRYRVIADYPNSKYPVNSILNFERRVDHNGEYWFCRKPEWILSEEADKYPHIFKPLGWWEERELSDLPKYVRLADPNSLWGLPKDCVRQAHWGNDEYDRLCCDLFPVMVNNIQLHRLLPATKEEYDLTLNAER